jgi:hypothetical protein
MIYNNNNNNNTSKPFSQASWGRLDMKPAEIEESQNKNTA